MISGRFMLFRCLLNGLYDVSGCAMIFNDIVVDQVS